MTNPTTDSRAKPTVLIVDDEEMVTISLSSFLSLETDYQVVTFQSPRAALDFLRKRSVDAIISDFYMPEMNGLEFLAAAKKMYPDVPRILLTGYADKENAIRGINEVGLFQYIEKPWDNQAFRLILRNAITNHSLQRRLLQKLKELDTTLLQKDRIEQLHSSLKQELELARRVQQSLLPQALSRNQTIDITVKYIPALEIGGDFYDIIHLQQNVIAVLIADVTGHGIQAALSTTLLKLAFSGFAGKACTPAQILEGMNKTMCLGLPGGIYVAALVATIDERTGACRISNGGIPYPMLFRRRTNELERIHANGLLLGVASAESHDGWEEVCLDLQDDDLIIISTDGLNEVENDAGEQFEANQMMTSIEVAAAQSAAALLDELVASAQQFARNNYSWDDLTLLALHYRK